MKLLLIFVGYPVHQICEKKYKIYLRENLPHIPLVETILKLVQANQQVLFSWSLKNMTLKEWKSTFSYNFMKKIQKRFVPKGIQNG